MVDELRKGTLNINAKKPDFEADTVFFAGKHILRRVVLEYEH